MTLHIPPRDQVTDDTPLRLDVAAALAFPNGGITGASLRREAERGRLAVERISGKYFTTLRHIREMRDTCRAPAKAPASTSAGAGKAESGSSSTASAKSQRARLRASLERLKQPSRDTSEASRGPLAPVIPLPSRSPKC